VARRVRALAGEGKTSVESRLTVFDKTPAEDPGSFRESFGPVTTLEELLSLVSREVPPRLAAARVDRAGNAPPAAINLAAPSASPRSPQLRPLRGSDRAPSRSPFSAIRQPASFSPPTVAEIVELAYEMRDWKAPQGGSLGSGLYEPYAVQSIAIPNAKPHPTTLVQSVAMASVGLPLNARFPDFEPPNCR
jgi:hypothetical protein